MTAQLAINELFRLYSESLALQWIAGQNGGDRVIRQATDIHVSRVGYLSLIHPNQIQIIGLHEMDYLEGLAPSSYQELLQQLFSDSLLAAIILVDCPAIPPYLLEQAEQQQVPLFTSLLAGDNVINYLHSSLAQLIAQRTTLHGVFMDVLGIGVLIMGKSGTGKSELALELISRGHRLVADDAPEFSRIASNIIVGTASPSEMGAFLEVRGLGILNVQALFGDSALKRNKYLRLIIQLEQMRPERLHSIDRLQGDYRVRQVLGIDIPEIGLPVAPGRNLAVLLECAVRNHSLKDQGYNAADDFCERQKLAMLEEAK